MKKPLINRSYGYQLTSADLPDISIKLPIDPEGNPDWDYMDKYVKVAKKVAIF